MARRDAVRWPGAAWRAALAWCALPRLRGCPAWCALPRLRGCPAWRAAPAWRGCPGVVCAAPAGVIAQRCTSPRLAWWPSVARCPGLAWLPSAARRPGWRGCPAWRAAPAGMIGPALHVGLAGVTGPDGAPPRPTDDPETEGGLRAYIRNPEGIATTARPLPPKKIFLSP